MVSGSSLYPVVEAMLPMYVAAAIGYVSACFEILTAEQAAGISLFVSRIAGPFLIFRIISANNIYTMNLRFMAADIIQKAVVLAALGIWARFYADAAAITAAGSSRLPWVITFFSLCTLPNAIIIGIPVLGSLYGDVSQPLLAQVLVLQFVMWFVLVIFMLEYIVAKRGRVHQQTPASDKENGLQLPSASDQENALPWLSDDDERALPAKAMAPPPPPRRHSILVLAGKKIAMNPNVISSVLGLIWSFLAFRFNFKMPQIIDDSLKMFAVSIIGLSMFSVGNFMANQKKFVSCGYSMAALALTAKFVVGPLVMAIASFTVGLRSTVLRMSIVQAALPTTVLSFVYAAEYHVHAEIMSTALIVGNILAVPVTLIYYIILEL